MRVRRVRWRRGRRDALEYIHTRWFGGMEISFCVVKGGRLKQAFLRMWMMRRRRSLQYEMEGKEMEQAQWRM